MCIADLRVYLRTYIYKTLNFNNDDDDVIYIFNLAN